MAFTNEDLYLWMQGNVAALLRIQCFAFDTARKAEKTEAEPMRPEVDAQDS
jgi:hypothetical protein